LSGTIASTERKETQKELSTGNLKRITQTETQTRKSRFERWTNVEGIFELSNPEAFEGKHILLVDDVVTTGSTLEACAQSILSKTNARVSIATLATA
jgi:predicted amidophosphoribosyltransferase